MAWPDSPLSSSSPSQSNNRGRATHVFYLECTKKAPVCEVEFEMGIRKIFAWLITANDVLMPWGVWGMAGRTLQRQLEASCTHLRLHIIDSSLFITLMYVLPVPLWPASNFFCWIRVYLPCPLGSPLGYQQGGEEERAYYLVAECDVGAEGCGEWRKE